MISKPKPHITLVTIPKNQIKKLDIAMASEPLELMGKAYSRLGKPDFMLNGGFFDMSNGKTASNLIDDGVIKGKGCSDFGLVANGNAVKFGNISEADFDFIGGTPSLIKNGKIDIDQNYGDSFNNTRHPRSAVGENKDNIFLVAVDGRKTNAPGMTLKELAEFMLSLGCTNAINLDGGGSTRLLHNGEPINSPTENRAVGNFICVYLLKEQQKVAAKKKIFIDPGHGGSDPGAQANGLVEKQLNLTVSLKLKELLLARGFDVKLSRESDISVSLTERCNMANSWGADYFISVHHNAGGGDGWEIIHTVHTTKSEGDELAEAIGKEFSKTGQNKRRIFSLESKNYPGQDYYTVIQKTNMAAIITEYAFLDSNDYKAVDSIEKLYKEAEAIADGLCNYLGVASASDSNNSQDVKGGNTNMTWEEKNKEFVKTVQKAIGVDVDGLAGPKTISAFDAYVKKSKGDSSDEIKQVWTKLMELLK